MFGNFCSIRWLLDFATAKRRRKRSMKWKRRSVFFFLDWKKDCFATPQSRIVIRRNTLFFAHQQNCKREMCFRVRILHPNLRQVCQICHSCKCETRWKTFDSPHFPSIYSENEKRGENIIPDPSVNSTEFSRHNKNKRQERSDNVFSRQIRPRKKKEKKGPR